MNWPSHADYQDAIQNPSLCFLEPELKAGEARTDMLGLPRVMSGNFASVYELICGDTRWAIRCFVRQVPGQQGRYARLSQHLNSLTLSCLVKFEYIHKGILVRGESYPIVKMQWVDGLPLNSWIDENLGNPDALRKLAADWRIMMNDLADHNLAHGDLQHGNVMVTPDNELRLVDYDGMYAPVFGRGRAPELGHINFQHPRRTADFYQEDLDNFSALVIYTSLLALAAEPKLWDTYYTGDNLVLSSSDFKNPVNSPVFDRLRQSPDPQVPQLVRFLEKCCLAPAENIPDFLTATEALDQGTLDCLPMKKPAPASRPAFSRPAPEAPGSTGSRTVSAVIPPGTSSTRGTRSAYESVPDVATQPLQQSGSSATSQTYAPASTNRSDASGLPRWIWGCTALAAVVIGLFIFAANQRNSTPQIEDDDETTSVESNSTTADMAEAATTAPSQRSPLSTSASSTPAPTARANSLKVVPLGSMKAHAGPVDAVALSSDGLWLASGSSDNTVKLWDAQNGQSKRTLKTPGEPVRRLHFLAQGTIVAGIADDNSILFWDVGTGILQRHVNDFTDNLFTVALSNDGQAVATGLSSDRKAVRIVDLHGILKRAFPNHESWVRSVDFSPNGALLASSCHDDSVTIWDTVNGSQIQRLSIPGNQMESLVFSPDNRLLVTGAEGNEIQVWNVSNGRTVHRLTGHSGEVLACAFSADGKLLATASADRTIKLWDVLTGTERQTLTGHTDAVTSVAFSTKNLLISGSADQTIRLWEVHP